MTSGKLFRKLFVCLCVMLPAVRPAPAGAAAAGSPAASAPPPAVYGYTPNQSAPGSARDAANRRAPKQAGSKSEPRQPVTSAEQERGENDGGGQRKVDLLQRSRDLVRNRRGEIKERHSGRLQLVEEEDVLIVGGKMLKISMKSAEQEVEIHV